MKVNKCIKLQESKKQHFSTLVDIHIPSASQKRNAVVFNPNLKRHAIMTHCAPTVCVNDLIKDVVSC